jgi:hypothetical protein
MKTKTFTAKSGETFTLSPVSQLELAPLAQKILPLQPKPPVEIVQTSNGSKEIVNEKNPEFLAAKQAFEMQQGVYMFAALVELGVDIDFTEEQQAAIDKRRKKRERLFPGMPENQFDTYVYVSMNCDEDELTQIANLITSINNPTAQQVQAHLDAFRPGVPEPTDNEDKDAPKWNQFQDREYELNALPGGEVLGDRPDSLLRKIGPRVAG